MSREAARIVAAGNKIPPQAERKAARTCKKLPVASFCASETAETGRIANGREQGDHVGGDGAAQKPRSGKMLRQQQEQCRQRRQKSTRSVLSRRDEGFFVLLFVPNKK